LPAGRIIQLLHMLQVMSLIDNELSEPYSIFTYRQAVGWKCVFGLCGAARCCAGCKHRPVRSGTPQSSCRYFLHSWPHLCFLVFKGEQCFGTVVAKMDVHRGKALRGYIAMLTVDKAFRYLGVGAAWSRMLGWCLVTQSLGCSRILHCKDRLRNSCLGAWVPE
jgi:hypothetical protein